MTTTTMTMTTTTTRGWTDAHASQCDDNYDEERGVDVHASRCDVNDDEEGGQKCVPAGAMKMPMMMTMR